MIPPDTTDGYWHWVRNAAAFADEHLGDLIEQHVCDIASDQFKIEQGERLEYQPDEVMDLWYGKVGADVLTALGERLWGQFGPFDID